MNNVQNRIVFVEKQHFNQFFLWGGLFVINLIFVIAFIKQIIFKMPVGNNPAPDAVLVLFMVGIALLTYAFIRMNLMTSISDDGISFRFFPFQRTFKHIDWESIKVCYIRRYSPIKEYGGWGPRKYPKNSAYCTSGYVGLQLVLKDESWILLGTNKPNEVEKVLLLLSKENSDIHFKTVKY